MIIKLEAMTKAVFNVMLPEEKGAKDLAETVMNLFGYNTYFINNTWDNDIQRFMYNLEDYGFVNLTEIECRLDGNTLKAIEELCPKKRMFFKQNWRIPYAFLKVNNIRKFAEMQKPEVPEETFQGLYDAVFEEISREQTAEVHA